MRNRKIIRIILTTVSTLVLAAVFSGCKPDIADLQATEQETIELLESLEQPYEIEINSNSGKVKVYVPDIMKLGQALDEAQEKMPDGVLVIERIPPPEGLNPDPTVHFPQLITRPTVYYDSEYTGNLELKNGYLCAGEHIIIWLPGYFVHNNNGTIEVWNRDGTVVGRVGEPISLGGGISELGNYILLLKEPLTPEAEGPFWFQAGARLNLNYTSELFNLEVIDCNGCGCYFFTKKTPLEEKGGTNHIISGIFSAGQIVGTKCTTIAVYDESDNTTIVTAYTPFWPAGYTARSNDGTLEILDAKGNVVARDGEKVTIDGVKISNNYSELFIQLRNEMPGECCYTNLLVERILQVKPEKEFSEEFSSITFVESENRNPEEILNGLPVYPGSTRLKNNLTTDITARQSETTSNGTPYYRTASAEYEVDADMDDIIDWYEEYFKEAGFHFETGYTTRKSFSEVTGRGTTYWLPSQPAVSVEIETYPKNTSLSVYDIIVSEDVRVALPYNNTLIPSDIECIDIEYRGYTPLTVTHAAIIDGLAGMVNALPVDPGYPRTSLEYEPAPIEFTIVFHSAVKGDITVIERSNQIYIEGHPVLWDTHGILMSTVKEIVQTREK